MDIALNLTPQTFMLAFAVGVIVEAIKQLLSLSEKPALKKLQPWISMFVGVALTRALVPQGEVVVWGKIIMDGVVVSAISMVTYDLVMGSIRSAKLKLPSKEEKSG